MKSIQRIIQSEEVKGGWIFIGKILGIILNANVTKVKTTPEGSLLEKMNKENMEKIIIKRFCGIFTSITNTPIMNLYTARRLGLVGEKV